MPIFAPAFREINYARIRQLVRQGYSDSDIASILNDDTDNRHRFTAADVSGYLKLGRAGSGEMLVSKKGLAKRTDEGSKLN